MRGFQATLFVIILSVLCVQAVRHVHLYIFGYEEPIVAPFDQFFEMEREIQLEGSTDDLLEEYQQTRQEIDALLDADPEKEYFEVQRENQELFARNSALSSELMLRQSRETELRDMWLFSIAGYVLIAFGMILYTRGLAWVGMALIAPGLIELMWWSSPSFTLGGAVQEYELLLINKILLTLIAIAVTISLWLLSRTKAPLVQSGSL